MTGDLGPARDLDHPQPPDPGAATWSSWLLAYCLGLAYSDREDLGCVEALHLAARGDPTVLEEVGRSLDDLEIRDREVLGRARSLVEQALAL